MPDSPSVVGSAVVGIIFTGIVLAAVAAWCWIASRLWRGQQLLPYEARLPVPWGGIDLAAIVALLLLVQQMCLSIGLLLADRTWPKAGEPPDPQVQLVVVAGTMVASLIVLALALALVTRRVGATPRDLGLDRSRLPYDLVCGAVAFAAASPVVYAIQWLFENVVKIEYKHPLIEALRDRPDRTTLWLVTLSAVIIAPLVEEFLFRVLLQGWLEKAEFSYASRTTAHCPLPISQSPQTTPQQPSPADRVGWLGLPLGAVPILITSVLFALMHLGHGAAPVPLFFYGIVLGFLYQRTGRLVPSLVAHMLLNGVSMVMLLALIKS